MSDHEPEPLAPELLRLLAAEKSRPAAAGPMQARVLERLGADLLAEVPLAGSPWAGLPGSPRVPRLAAMRLFRLPVALGLVAVGGLGGAGLHALLQDSSRPSQPPSITAPAASAPPMLAPEAPSGAGDQATELPVPARRGTPAPARRPATTAPSVEARPDDGQALGPDSELAAERALLEQARTALGHGSPPEALELLSRHAREFRKGRLSEERDALTVMSLAANRQLDEARSAATKFKRRYPRSMLLRSIEDALATPP